MNTSDSNDFSDPFGFVDEVEREMRDREYDALVQAGRIEPGTASIADLLARPGMRVRSALRFVAP